MKGKYELLVCVCLILQWTSEQLHRCRAEINLDNSVHKGDNSRRGTRRTALDREYTHRAYLFSGSLIHGNVQLCLWAELDWECAETLVQLHRGCSGSTCLCFCQALIQKSYWNPCQYLLAAAWVEVQKKKESCYKSSFSALLIRGSRSSSPSQSHKVLNVPLCCCQGAVW